MNPIEFGLKWTVRVLRIVKQCLLNPRHLRRNRIGVNTCRELFKGRRSLVLGTGRSLMGSIKSIIDYNPQPASIFVLWAVNNFALSAEFRRLKPQNYVMLDPDFFSKNSVDGTERRNALLEALRQVDWAMFIWLPFAAVNNKMWIEFDKTKPSNLTLIPFPVVTYETMYPMSISAYRHLGIAPNYQNVVTICAFFAILCGANEVGVLGADHNWHKDMIVGNDNVLRTHVPHFDDDKEPPPPVIFMHSIEKGPFTVSELFEALSITFKGHREVNKVACRLGQSVINLSENSFVDAYPREVLSHWLKKDA